ncbi:MAG: dethiobiotin synthase [Gammaproteobacteria bacterium]|nr:dethiobiotin synthase [Gammaproteobacteria bacterium]
MRQYFVTGTDTGVGKTLVTAALLAAAHHRGLRTLALKPVAAGCEIRGGEWMNDDARLLRERATTALDYAAVNPVALRLAMAPHLAARAEGRELAVAPLAAHCREVARHAHDLLLAEGAGGWLVPLNERETMADLAAALGWPVVLVVGMRLGCLNHALLTAGTIRAAGLRLAGWVANCIDPDMAARDGNIAALRERLPAPLLGIVPHLPPAGAVEAAAGALDIAALVDPRHA